MNVSGNIVSGKKIGKLKGIFYDKFGTEMGKATIRDVVHTPNSRFNLFSVTKRMQDGWILGGDKESMWLIKGDQKINFDIKISERSSILYLFQTRVQSSSHGEELLGEN